MFLLKNWPVKIQLWKQSLKRWRGSSITLETGIYMKRAIEIIRTWSADKIELIFLKAWGALLAYLASLFV